MQSLIQANPGFGLGLRTNHYNDFLRARQSIDWLEIISDNYLVPGGKPLQMLDRIRQDYPMVMHGVAMSLAAPGGADIEYLQCIKALADRVQPLWISDHLCWIGNETHQLHDLNPVPYTEEAARVVIASIKRAQDVLGRRLVVENVSSYVRFAESTASEWQFLTYVANESDCLLLLDINNVYVSSVNHQFDALEYLQGLPAHRIQQMHLAGHSVQDGYIIDTHDQAVSTPVWQLYREACALFGSVATMIERDDHIPALAVLVQELEQARQIAHDCSAHPKTQICPAALPSFTSAFDRQIKRASSLPQLQDDWVDSILSNHFSDDLSVVPALADNHRFGVYHHAYAARLTEVLRDVYEKTAQYMGSELFDTQVQNYVRTHPPKERSLRRFGHEFPQLLQHIYPENPELWELAQLDWDLRSVFDASDETALSQAKIAKDAEQLWLQQFKPLLSHLQLRPVTHSVAAIWSAIHADATVAEPQALAQATWLVIWRKNLQPSFQSVGACEAALLQHMQQGASIAQAFEQCAHLLTAEAQDFLPQTLSRWVESEILRSAVTN